MNAVRDLQKTDKEIADKVAAIESLVVGQYVPRDEFIRMVDALFTKLDRIEDKLGQRIDKINGSN